MREDDDIRVMWRAWEDGDQMPRPVAETTIAVADRRASRQSISCPVCGNASRTLETRRRSDNTVRRRRECETCDARFTTIERIEIVLPRGRGRPPAMRSRDI